MKTFVVLKKTSGELGQAVELGFQLATSRIHSLPRPREIVVTLEVASSAL